ncbi:MAG: Ig-like domain-containing protein [Culturomica sp.]|nr:Ig-like domain-containing protein [Culturomica sp.]
MNKHLSAALFCIAVCAAVLFTSCSKDDSPVSVSVTGVLLNTSSATLYVGDTVRLIATVQPTGATDQSLTWSSSDTTKAVVNSSGLVTAKSPGSATITVKTVDGNHTKSCAVTVNPVSVTDVLLNTSSATLYVGDTVRLIATVQPTGATDQSLIWSSSDTTKAVVNSSGLVTAKALGSAIITVKTNNGNKTATCTVTIAERPISAAGVLINGVYWAGCNIDAPGTFVATPESAGMFYQWNRKKGWPSTGSVTGWDYTTPSGDTWAAANDPCPSGWRVPTSDELDALLATDKVTNVWTTLNSVNGRKFTDKISGNSIFLPAAGYRDIKYGSLSNAGSSGYYYSSSPGGSSLAWSLSFDSSNAVQTNLGRSPGYSVRCVRAE